MAPMASPSAVDAVIPAPIRILTPGGHSNGPRDTEECRRSGDAGLSSSSQRINMPFLYSTATNPGGMTPDMQWRVVHNKTPVVCKTWYSLSSDAAELALCSGDRESHAWPVASTQSCKYSGCHMSKLCPEEQEVDIVLPDVGKIRFTVEGSEKVVYSMAVHKQRARAPSRSRADMRAALHASARAALVHCGRVCKAADMGCGRGQSEEVFRTHAATLRRLYLVDNCRDALYEAVSRMSALPVTAVHAPMGKVHLHNAMDVVLSQLAFHYEVDRVGLGPAMVHIRACLRVGGVFCATFLDGDTLWERLPYSDDLVTVSRAAGVARVTVSANDALDVPTVEPLLMKRDVCAAAHSAGLRPLWYTPLASFSASEAQTLRVYVSCAFLAV